jgi:hypothetical protein
MSTKKKLLIVGAHTLFFNGYFISDDAVRILANLIDDGFKIELLKLFPEEEDIVRNTDMPFWLREQLFLLDEIPINEKHHKDSFAVAGNKDDIKTLKLEMPVHFNYFDKLNNNNFNIVDLVICFGFSDEYFKQFCKTNNLLCVLNGVFISKSNKNYNGIAVSVDGDNDEVSKEYAVSKFNLAVKGNMYKPKHNETIMGVSYKGRGLKNDIGSVPVLFI